MRAKDARAARIKRHKRVRGHLRVSSDRPRLCVFRSLKHIYAQIIDDSKGCTLASVSTLDQAIKPEIDGKSKIEIAALVGASIAKKATVKGLTKVTFDKGSYKYHGRVKALAEAAREAGLEF
jgi:large subunit ribosomal protein L18